MRAHQGKSGNPDLSELITVVWFGQFKLEQKTGYLTSKLCRFALVLYAESLSILVL